MALWRCSALPVDKPLDPLTCDIAVDEGQPRLGRWWKKEMAYQRGTRRRSCRLDAENHRGDIHTREVAGDEITDRTPYKTRCIFSSNGRMARKSRSTDGERPARQVRGVLPRYSTHVRA